MLNSVSMWLRVIFLKRLSRLTSGNIRPALHFRLQPKKILAAKLKSISLFSLAVTIAMLGEQDLYSSLLLFSFSMIEMRFKEAKKKELLIEK